jgi:glyoxylate utilization-related uncharacterized protein
MTAIPSRRFVSSQYQIRLREDEVFSLQGAMQTLYIVSGRAWVTLDGKDVFLNAGQQITLPRSKYAVVISAIKRREVVCEIMEA